MDHGWRAHPSDHRKRFAARSLVVGLFVFDRHGVSVDQARDRGERARLLLVFAVALRLAARRVGAVLIRVAGGHALAVLVVLLHRVRSVARALIAPLRVLALSA